MISPDPAARLGQGLLFALRLGDWRLRLVKLAAALGRLAAALGKLAAALGETGCCIWLANPSIWLPQKDKKARKNQKKDGANEKKNFFPFVIPKKCLPLHRSHKICLEVDPFPAERPGKVFCFWRYLPVARNT